MHLAPSLTFNFINNTDFLKKSTILNVQTLLEIQNTNVLSISSLNAKNLVRFSKITEFWALEIVTLQKSFFNYKVKNLRKVFYMPYSSSVVLKDKNLVSFMYTFMKESLASTPYLKYFLVYQAIRNLKIEPLAIFGSLSLENRLFYLIGNLFLLLKTKKLRNQIWLSMYKMLA